MLDQLVFTVCDFATGIAADKVTRVLGRLGVWVVAVTVVSCLAFLALPFVAAAGAPLLLAVTLVWTVSSSALRAPPLMLLGKYAAKPAIPYLSSLAMLGYGLAGAARSLSRAHAAQRRPAPAVRGGEPGAGADRARHDLGRTQARRTAKAR